MKKFWSTFWKPEADGNKLALVIILVLQIILAFEFYTKHSNDRLFIFGFICFCIGVNITKLL